MKALLHRYYSDRWLAILVAVVLTWLIATIWTNWALREAVGYSNGTRGPVPILVVAQLCAVVIAVPALLGIVLVMIPVQEATKRWSIASSWSTTVALNCLLVLLVFAAGALLQPPGMAVRFEYLVLAVAAALIWRFSDRTMSRRAING